MRNLLIAAACVLAAHAAWGAERKVDPTFLRRHIASVQPASSDLTAPGCRYKPVFGAGDSDSSVARGVSRFGEITIDPGAACKPVSYSAEEQVYVILEGSGLLLYGSESVPVKKHDFAYLPAGVQHGISSRGAGSLRLIVAGFRIPAGTAPPPALQIANIDDVRLETVGGHPDSVRYRLLMGDTQSKRDRIAAGHLLVSLYIMEFAPGGTNTPHHHDAEEEIYVLLDGTGEMVAGSGMDGIEARFPAKSGDAYFFRLNCTAGFYNGSQGSSRILAVRSTYPRSR